MLPLFLIALTADQVPDSSEALAARVEIVRTEYGVPHILAEDLKAMGFGLGYVQSEDYGASIATALVESRGTLARHLGRAELDSDFVERQVHARAAEAYGLLDPRARAVYAGFAEGVNRYIRTHPQEFPSWIQPRFTGIDALARDVQTWSRGDAARFVRGLEGAPGTGDAADAEAEAFALDGSNAWALGGSRTISGHTILLRNPHLSWATDADLLTRGLGSTYYEAHMRVPGVVEFYGDFRIGSAFGIIGGFNARLGWATTNNYPRYSQVYALEAHPTLENHAMLDGEPLAFEERVTTVDYLAEDGTIATESRSTWWTEIGPVIHRSDGRIYVIKDPRDGEFRRGEQFLKMMMARSLDEWLEVMRMRAHPSSNFTYADADGNIVHYYNARLPQLPHEPTGDSAAFASSRSDVWSELVSWDELPLYLNPLGGYVQQANDTPDYTNLNVPLGRDTVAPNLPEPRLRLRSQLSLGLVHNERRFALEDVVRLKHSPRMLAAERLVDDLVAALRGSGADDLARAADLLDAWDRTAAAESRGGVLFARWFDVYSEHPDSGAVWAQPWDPAHPASTPTGVGDPDYAATAMRRALEWLEGEGLSPDARWGDVHRVVRGGVDAPVSGCPSDMGCFRALSFGRAAPGRYVANRGDAWVLVVEFSDIPRAYTVLSYGQTARAESPHFDDQAGMFASGAMKTVAWTDEAIADATIVRYRPGEEVSR